MCRFIKKVLFFFCILFLCISCATSRRLLFDGSGAGTLRKDIGRIEGVEQSITNATELIESYSSNLETGIERERSLIEEFRKILQRIRGRGDDSSQKAGSKD